MVLRNCGWIASGGSLSPVVARLKAPKAVPDTTPTEQIAAPDTKSLANTTAPEVDTVAVSSAAAPRSHQLVSSRPNLIQVRRPNTSHALLGSAVALLLSGVMVSTIKLRRLPADTSRMLPPSQTVHASEESSREVHTLSADQRGTTNSWWLKDTIYIVTDTSGSDDPSSASPVLVRTTHGKLLPGFEGKGEAGMLAAQLEAWGRQRAGVFGEGSSSGAPSQFRVVVLQPRGLNIFNVPPIVLMNEGHLSSGALDSPEAWQTTVAEAAPPQLRAWQEHKQACQSAAPAAPDAVEASAAGVSSTYPTDATTSDHTRTGAGPMPPPAGADAGHATAQQAPHAAEPGMSAAEAAIAKAMRLQPATSLSHSSGAANTGSAPGHAGSAPATAPPRVEEDPDEEPTVYASVEEMKRAEQQASGQLSDDGEPLRLLSESETDSSLVHANFDRLPVVFAPMLFRGGQNGVSSSGSSALQEDVERMMFTVDATLDERDPDVVALVFEDPVDATALLSVLAHVRGFRDPDAVVRRVVPMPVDAAQDVAREQGASVMCMAKGFQKKAEVRAGREIGGLLSKIAGARWASLVDAQIVK